MVRRRIAQFPEAVRAVIQAAHALRRPVTQVTADDVESWARTASASYGIKPQEPATSSRDAPLRALATGPSRTGCGVCADSWDRTTPWCRLVARKRWPVLESMPRRYRSEARRWELRSFESWILFRIRACCSQLIRHASDSSKNTSASNLTIAIEIGAWLRGEYGFDLSCLPA